MERGVPAQARSAEERRRLADNLRCWPGADAEVKSDRPCHRRGICSENRVVLIKAALWLLQQRRATSCADGIEDDRKCLQPEGREAAPGGTGTDSYADQGLAGNRACRPVCKLASCAPAAAVTHPCSCMVQVAPLLMMPFAVAKPPEADGEQGATKRNAKRFVLRLRVARCHRSTDKRGILSTLGTPPPRCLAGNLLSSAESSAT